MSTLIRPLTLEELKLLMAMIYQEEHWNFGERDPTPYYKADPTGFLGFFSNDKLIGGISIVMHGKKFGFIGLFFIKATERSNGYGTKLFSAALQTLKERLTANSPIGLYAVPQQISRYKGYGFNSEFNNYHFQWNRTKSTAKSIQPKSIQYSSSSSAFFNGIAEYDEKIFSAPRKELLASLLKEINTSLFMLITENKITGFGIIRQCKQDYRIGPLYADNFDNAKILAEDLANEIATTGKNIILDMPEANRFTKAFAEYFNLVEISEINTKTMFINKPEQLSENIDKNFAALSLELG